MSEPPTIDRSGRVAPVHAGIQRAAAYSWRILAIALAVAAAVWLCGQLLVVIVPLAIAALLARALSPLSSRLRDAGWRPGLAAAATLLGFVVALAAIIGAVGVAVAGEAGELGPTLSQGVDDIENWLVDDGPFDVSHADIAEWRAQAGDALSSFVGSGRGSIASGALVVGEMIVGAFLALVVTFFFLKDGRRMVTAALNQLPGARRDLGGRAAGRAWDAAGGYLRGAALLGVVEAIVIGVALLLVGGSLVIPVMVLTVLAAFVPIVGAIVAGTIASLVALVTAGAVPALIVAAVALVVQQLDNELLAPVIYGRAVQLHPLVVLLGIAAGGSLFGVVGTFLAVPVLAVTINAADELRDAARHRDEARTIPS